MTATSTASKQYEQYEQYTEYARQAQDVLLNTFDTWTSTVREASAQLPKPAQTAAEAERVIDEAVDFASKVLAVQRAYAHDVVKATTGALRRIPGFASA
jgi:acetyl-CoA carboxylase carboxyltransferase component